MGTTKNRRRRERKPWELVIIRTGKGTILTVACVRCRKRARVRYWDPDFAHGVCYDCVPAPVLPLLPRQPDSDSGSRPMALIG